MTIFPGSTISGASSAAYDIDNSCKFAESESSYLSRTPGSTGNTKTWTISCWVKFGAVTGNRHIFSAGGPAHSGGADGSFIVWNPKLQLYMYPQHGPAATLLTTAAEYKDPSAWYHLVFMLDTTQVTSTDRAKIWVNGEQITDFDAATYPPQNDSGAGYYFNSTREQVIANEGERWRYKFDGYMAEFYMCDGSNLTADIFGERNAYNQWVPRNSVDVKTSFNFSTNGFFMEFKNSGALGTDTSGKGNNYATTNVVASDQMIDTPTNNFCVWNPLFVTDSTNPTITDGNLKVLTPTGSAPSNGLAEGTIALPSSGKWYWEAVWESGSFPIIGVTAPDTTGDDVKTEGRGYYYDGTKWGAGSSGSYGNSYATGDVIGVAVDMYNGAIYFAKNNTWQDSGDPTSGASKTGAAYTDLLSSSDFSSGILPAVSDLNSGSSATWIGNFGQDSSFDGEKTEQGNGGAGEDFYYTPPTGYKALNTNNLFTSEINLPGGYFNTILYDDGAGAKTGVGFQPDLTWVKSRGSAKDHKLTDAVRGVTKAIVSNDDTAQTTDGTGLTAFGPDGFTVGADTDYSDTTGVGMVAWNWKETPTAGFDIVSYTGTGVARTVSHNLGVEPAMMIVKNLTSVENWQVYHKYMNAVPEDYYMELNTTAVATDDVTAWNDTAPTSSVFTVGTKNATNKDTDSFIAYLFADIEGYSKMGSYVANENADGPFIYTGFKPAVVLIANVENATHGWYWYDNKRDPDNPEQARLMPNDTSVELYTDPTLDFVSNGFKLRTASTFVNDDGETNIYMAFAESPFKYSNAR